MIGVVGIFRRSKEPSMDRDPDSFHSPVDGPGSGPDHRFHRHILHSSALPLLATMVTTLMLAIVLIVIAAMDADIGDRATSLLLS
jgi:hypothetical protein